MCSTREICLVFHQTYCNKNSTISITTGLLHRVSTTSDLRQELGEFCGRIRQDIQAYLDTADSPVSPQGNRWRSLKKIHSPHSRDFSRELGGWVLCVLRGFLCSDDQKVLSAKIPSGNTFHTDGVTIFGKEATA